MFIMFLFHVRKLCGHTFCTCVSPGYLCICVSPGYLYCPLFFKIFRLDFGIVLTVWESLFFMVMAKRYINTLLGKILLNIRFNLATIICFVSFCTLIPSSNLKNRNDHVSVDVQVVYNLINNSAEYLSNIK